MLVSRVWSGFHTMMNAVQHHVLLMCKNEIKRPVNPIEGLQAAYLVLNA